MKNLLLLKKSLVATLKANDVEIEDGIEYFQKRISQKKDRFSKMREDFLLILKLAKINNFKELKCLQS